MPPGSFTLLITKVHESGGTYEEADVEVRLHPSRANAVQMHFPARPEAYAELVNSQGLLVHVKPYRVLPFAENGGRLTIEWDGDQPKVIEAFSGERGLGLPNAMFDRYLEFDLGGRTKLFCDPAEIGLAEEPSTQVAWTIARAFWEYQAIVRDVSRIISTPGPRLAPPEGVPRQLRNEQDVLHVPALAGRKGQLFSDLRRDLEALGMARADYGAMFDILFPLGDSAYELARIEGESGRDELWAERRGVPFDAEGRIQRLSEDADEWCWQYVPW
ncbi:MAG: hypothetical protein O2816_04505 [Planctomycetota bacterium]|nr:hypothetical protein [Planctomycetota bacterium]